MPTQMPKQEVCLCRYPVPSPGYILQHDFSNPDCQQAIKPVDTSGKTLVLYNRRTWNVPVT